MLIALIISVFCLCAALPLGAQSYEVTRRITAAGGLSNDFVVKLAIDGQGYVWAATEAGVNRIAGQTCRTFELGDWGSGLKITALHYDQASDQVLIGTENGLGIYHCPTGKMTFATAEQGLIDYSINDIAAAAQGGVWLVYGHGRIQHLDCTTLRTTDLVPDHYRGARCAWDDGHGHLYLGHGQQGMSIVNLADGRTTHYIYKEADAASLPGNNVRCIMQDSGGRIWVGTERGLARFDPSSGTFAKVTHASDSYDDNVYDICEMQDGTLWVATDLGGIKVIDLRQATGTDALHIEPTAVATSSINTLCVVQDEFGNIWVGNHSTGIDFISRQKALFSMLAETSDANRIRPVYAMSTRDGHIWVGAEDELSRWDEGRLTGRWNISSSLQREHSVPRCIMPDREGHVWLGMEDEGVLRFWPTEGRFERIDIGHEASDIHAFLEDADGRIWIGSEFGVYTYADGHTTCEEAVNQLTHNAPVTSFVRLPGGQLFITTLGTGVYVVDPLRHTNAGLRMQDGLPSDKVNQAMPARDGSMWLATYEGLVHVADPAHLQGLTIYDQRQGLASNHIRALQQDARGRIWMSTYSGIACLDRDSGHFYNYTQFGQRPWGGFAGAAALTDAQGRMHFGSASGICTFDPLDFDNHTRVSAVQLVACEADTPTDGSADVVQLMPDGHGRISCSHRQNTLRLVFTLRNYAQTGREEYSYMMKGLSNEWTYIGSEQSVLFRSLPPGRYTFVLRAKLQEQDWDDAAQTQLAISIAPPLWRTWWAFVLYALCLAALLGAAVWTYKRRLTLRSKLQLAKQESLQKQELNEERLRFYTNITHELRTPLTLILGPLDDLSHDTTLSAAAHRKVSVISKSAEQLRRLINEVLEFRKTETQNRRLAVARGDLGQFVHELCINYQELYHKPQVELRHTIQPGLPHLYFDSEVVTTVLNNFLSNAIKYTEQGSITVEVGLDADGWVALSVTDTGFGIAAEALPHIFDRYYQAKGRHQASGTGIGLALVKSLADLHEGRLSVTSTEGRGSRFAFALDPANTYPDVPHKEDSAPVPAEQAAEAAGPDAADTANEQPVMLIVEDNADIRQYIADSLADDFRILAAENGREGLQTATEQVPDIIVSDIMMPHMDGIEMTRRIKADMRTSHIPVVLLTAKDTDADKEEGYLGGADSYLTKPFTAKLLNTRVHNLLEARRRLAEYIMGAHAATPAHAIGQAEPTPVPNTATLSRLDREFLERLNTVIEDNIMSQDLDLPFVTDKMAMSHSTFYRKVKALTGLTAKEYIRKMRLRHCYKLLESGDYNVSEAAMMTGFNQLAHFRETFRNEFGMAPSDVMRRRRQGTVQPPADGPSGA